VIAADEFSVDADSGTEGCLCFLGPVGFLIKIPEGLMGLSDTGTVRWQYLLTRGQSLLQQRLCLVVRSHREVELSEVVLALRDIGVDRGIGLLPYGESLKQKLSMSIVIEVLVEFCFSIQHIGDRSCSRPVVLLIDL
jgi:hypothetical protein